MAGNAALLLAGISGSGAAGNSLAYFAPYGNAAPTNAATAPPAGFLDAGWVSEKGLAAKVKETSKDIRGYGSFAAIRKVVTASDTAFDLDFLESNTTSLSIYHRKPLTGTGSLTSSAGLISFGTGAASMPSYAAIFDLVDGVNLLRAYCPQQVDTVDQVEDGRIGRHRRRAGAEGDQASRGRQRAGSGQRLAVVDRQRSRVRLQEVEIERGVGRG